jgi:hypothetical protein
MLPPKVRQMHPAGLFPRLSPFADLAREGDKLIAGQWGGNKVTIWLELDAAPFGCQIPDTKTRNLDVDHSLTPSLHRTQHPHKPPTRQQKIRERK